jgi:hypothetical protein
LERKQSSEEDPELGVVAHAYNPSYLGGRDWKDYCSRPTQAKVSKTHLNKARHDGMCPSSQLNGRQRKENHGPRPAWAKAQDPIWKIY